MKSKYLNRVVWCKNKSETIEGGILKVNKQDGDSFQIFIAILEYPHTTSDMRWTAQTWFMEILDIDYNKAIYSKLVINIWKKTSQI